MPYRLGILREQVAARYFAVRSGTPSGKRLVSSTPSTWLIASSVFTVGLAGAPGFDSPFSSFWYVYLLKFAS